MSTFFLNGGVLASLVATEMLTLEDDSNFEKFSERESTGSSALTRWGSYAYACTCTPLVRPLTPSPAQLRR